MKTLIFSVCIFALFFDVGNSRKIGKKLGPTDNTENYNTCLEEHQMSDDDIYTINDIIHDRHKKPENEEKAKKNACIIQCLLEKAELMEGSEYNIEKMREVYIARSNIQSTEDQLYKDFENCLNESKDMTDKCEKSFALTECILKAEDKVSPHSAESHEENEHAE
ncbi:hypothetical protein P5V15_005499 [Pogonomyrmex californicus]